MPPIDVSGTSERIPTPAAVIATALSILSAVVVLASAAILLFNALTPPASPLLMATGFYWIQHGSLAFAISLAVLCIGPIRRSLFTGRFSRPGRRRGNR